MIDKEHRVEHRLKKDFDLAERPIKAGTIVWLEGRLAAASLPVELWICSDDSQQMVTRTPPQEDWSKYFEPL